MATPWRHPKTNVYYLRRQVPEPLRPHFGGRALWKESLRTKDPDEARRLFAIENARLEERFAEARRAAAAVENWRAIKPERAATLIAKACERLPRMRYRLLLQIWSSEEAAAELLGGADIALMPPETAEGFQLLSPKLLPGDLFLRVMRVRSVQEQLSVAEGLLRWVRQGAGPGASDLPRTHENDIVLLAALHEAVQEQVNALRAEVLSPLDANKSRLQPDMRLLELWEDWSNKTPKPGFQGANEAKSTVCDFIEFAGDLPVGSITKNQLLNFRDAVAMLPAAMSKVDRALPFRARCAKFENHKQRPVSPGSVKRRLGHLQALLAHAANVRNYIVSSPGTGIVIEGYSRKAGAKRPFLDGELKTLLASRLFVQPKGWSYKRDTVSDVTLAWFFVLGTTSGARIEEIGQTDLKNVKVDGHVVYLDLGADAHVKNELSRRMIPLHRRVLDLGFLDFVEALRRAGAVRLFPELHASGLAKLSKEASKLANRYIDRAVGEQRDVSFHSTRHKFKDLAREALVPERMIDQITGHAPVTVGQRYGFGARLRVLKEQLDIVQFEMVDWTAIQQAFAHVNWDQVASALISMADRIAAERPA